MKKIENAYRKEYRIRVNVPGRKSLIVTFPYEVVEREARKHKLSIEQFLERYQAIAHYNNFDGVYYKFEEIK